MIEGITFIVPEEGTVCVFITSTPVGLTVIMTTDRVEGGAERVVWTAWEADTAIAVFTSSVGEVERLVTNLVFAVHVVVVTSCIGCGDKGDIGGGCGCRVWDSGGSGGCDRGGGDRWGRSLIVTDTPVTVVTMVACWTV